MRPAAAILLLLLGAAGAARAATIYVDAAAVAPEDGSEAHPFNTVEEGVAAANADDAVRLAAGSYVLAGNLTLPKAIAIEGAGKDATTVTGGEFLVTAPKGAAAARFRALAMVGARYGFVLYEPADILIRDCKVDSVAVAEPPTHRYTVEDSEILGEVRFSEADATAPTEHAIRRSSMGGVLRFSHGSGPVVNLVEDSTVAGQVELYSENGTAYLIRGNMLGGGLRNTSGAVRTTISGNTFLVGGLSDESGTAEPGAETLLIADNTFLAGALTLDGASVTLRNNVVMHGDPAAPAVLLRSGAPTNAIGNRMTIPFSEQGNGCLNYFDVPVLGTSAAAGLVADNVLTGGACGVIDSSAGDFVGNIVEGADIGAASAGGGVWRGNTIRGHQEDGVVWKGSGPFEGNVVEDNGGAGVRVLFAADLGGGAAGSAGENALRGNAGGDLVVDASVDPDAEISAIWNLWDHWETADIAAMDIVDERPSPTGAVVFEPYAPESLLYLVVHGRAPGKDAGDALALLLIRAGL